MTSNIPLASPPARLIVLFWVGFAGLNLTGILSDVARSGPADSPTTSQESRNLLAPFQNTWSVMEKESVGQTYRSNVFDWRSKTLLFGLGQGPILEYNNFDSVQTTLNLLFPMRDSLFGLEIGSVSVKSTRATEDISKTPYSQEGRPSRWIATPSWQTPLFEGIGSSYLPLFDTLQFLTLAGFGLRYHFYKPWSEDSLKENIKSLFSPDLSSKEQELVSEELPAGMKLSGSRLDLHLSLGFHIFSAGGLGLHSIFHWNLPIGGDEERELVSHWDLNLGVGYGF